MIDTYDKVRDIVRSRNREIMLEVWVGAVMGIVFTAVTIAGVFWIFYVFGWFGISRALRMSPAGFAAAAAGLFLVVSTWSAWRRVDPLQSLEPMTAGQEFLTMLSLGSSHLMYFSPRHASAGFAQLLIGGPASLFESLGRYRDRLRATDDTLHGAAVLIERVGTGLPLEEVSDRHALILLRRIGLVKLDGTDLVLTRRGFEVLGR